MDFKAMTDKELIGLWRDCYASVYVTECYGTKDMLIMDRAAEELKRRGYDLDWPEDLEVPMPVFTKVTEDE